MEVLPEYNDIASSIELPSYHSPIKCFTIKSKFSLTLGIHRCNWNICERSTELIWYKLYPNQRGISLKESSKKELVTLIQAPTNSLDRHYNFLLPTELDGVTAYMDLNASKELLYKIHIYKQNLKGRDMETYCISKRTANHGVNSVWCLYNQEYPNEILAKFTLSFSCQRIADIAFYGNIAPFEFHIFLTAISQCLLHLFSVHSNMAL